MDELRQKIRVVIAEDEESIRSHLAKKIIETDSDFEIVAQVENGALALEAVRAHNAHVVITDIKMPVMDGMELVRQLYLCYPTVLRVILSGYSDFAYAQQAIRHGVINYLLKPISQEELENTLFEVKSEVQSLNRSRTRNIVYSCNYVARKSSEYSYAVFLLSIGNLCYDKNDKLLSEHYKSISAGINWHEIFDTFYPNAADWYLADEEDYNQKLICFSVPPHEHNNHFALAQKLQQKINKSCPDIPVSVCTSEECFCSNDVWICTQRMRNILRNKIVAGQSRVFSLENDESYEKDNKFAILKLRISDKLVAPAQKKDVHEISSELELIFNYMINNDIPQHDAQNIIIHIISMLEFSGALAEPFASKLQTKALRSISLCRRPKEMVNELKHIFISVFEEPGQTAANTSSLAQQLAEYIDENYITLDNLEIVAKKFQYNYAYLSRLFKKEKGISMSRYVLAKRIELAKHLIENNENLSMVEIGRMSGYPDSRYFSRVFKAYTGKTPTEYKQSVIVQ